MHSSSRQQPPLLQQASHISPPPTRKLEPHFQTLLTSQSQRPLILPEGRPEKVLCLIDRDDDFFIEVERLRKAVILKGDQVGANDLIQMVVDTGLVREEKLRVARLSGGRVLVHLPNGLQVDTLITALPLESWEKGYDAQPWSEIRDAEVVLPRFKLIIDLEDFPVHMWKEEAAQRPVSCIGLYLGSIPLVDRSDYSHWRVAIATTDLGRVPDRVGFVIGGIEHISQVKVFNWEIGPVYSPSDFPEHPVKYPRSVSATDWEPEALSSDDSSQPSQGDPKDMVYCSRRVLYEMCAGLAPTDIPQEIRRIMVGTKVSGGVPFRALMEMVDAVDNFKTLIRQASEEVPKAGRHETQGQSVSRVITRKGFTEQVIPDLSTLFSEDQHLDGCEPLGQTTIVPQSQYTALESEQRQIPELVQRQLPEKGKDKMNVSFEKGQSSTIMRVHEAGQSVTMKDDTTRDSAKERSHRIPPKDKEGGPPKNQPRPSAFSRNMRFRGLLDKAKSRPCGDNGTDKGAKDVMGQQTTKFDQPQGVQQVNKPHKPKEGPRQ